MKALVTFPQEEHSTQATQDSDFVVQLRMICDSVLYAYLSKVVDTAEKRHYLDLSYATVAGQSLGSPYLYMFLDEIHKYGIVDLHLSVFQPHDLHVLLVSITSFPDHLAKYFEKFRSDPERSKEFHYEVGPFHTFIATRCMRFLGTTLDPR